MKYVFLDTETTGLNPELHSIHQLSLHFVDTVAKVYKKFTVYCRPWEGRVISDDALEKGKVTLEQIMAYPAQEESFQNFKTFMDSIIDPFNPDDKAVFLGYNVKFDQDFLKEWINLNESEGRKYGNWFYHQGIDIMPLSKILLIPHLHLLPFNFSFKLVNVCRVLEIALEGEEHEASEDSRLCLELYRKAFPNEFLFLDEIS